MENIQAYRALKIEFGRVSWYIGCFLSALLGRQIRCRTQLEDDSYWSVSAIDDRFTNEEIMKLICYVKGDSTMIRRCIPPDSNTSRSLDMDLCRALLQHVLKLKWDQEFLTRDALWILGTWNEIPKLPNPSSDIVFVDNKEIDCSRLMPMEAFLSTLVKEGCNLTELIRLCDANENAFGHPLYWMYPIPDGVSNGCYLVLVKEGVLALSYDEVQEGDHEVFLRKSARLCTAEDMAWLLDEWNRFSVKMTDSLSGLLYYLERKEEMEVP